MGPRYHWASGFGPVSLIPVPRMVAIAAVVIQLPVHTLVKPTPISKIENGKFVWGVGKQDISDRAHGPQLLLCVHRFRAVHGEHLVEK